jgi:hypothetical protein
MYGAEIYSAESFLYLASNKIGDQGAVRLAAVLQHHSTRPGAPAGPSPALSYLDLRHNQIGSEGVSWATLFAETRRKGVIKEVRHMIN